MYLAQSISPLEVILTLLYLAAVAFLGWLGYQRTKTTADYLVARRKVHPFIMSMSYTSVIVGFGGRLIIFLFMPLSAAAVLIGGSEFLATAFSMPHFVALLVFGIITASFTRPPDPLHFEKCFAASAPGQSARAATSVH